jgi:hypothetical protein
MALPKKVGQLIAGNADVPSAPEREAQKKQIVF